MVSSLTSTVTVNAAFLQEIKEVNQELWQQLAGLRHRCQRPLAPGMCRQLVEQLGQVRDQVALHFALEEAYGYFDDPVEVAPRLCRQADALRSEHKELYSQLSDLVDRAEQMLYQERLTALAVWVGPVFLEFDARLRSHEERENDLIFEAYDADIGGED